MTYTITENCIGCQRCLPKCPTSAIQTNGQTLWIEAERCNHCAGVSGVPQCWAICPTNGGCIPFFEKSPSAALQAAAHSRDYWEAWFNTYSQVVRRLKTTHPQGYWQRWFDTYAQTLDGLKTHGGAGNVPLLP